MHSRHAARWVLGWGLQISQLQLEGRGASDKGKQHGLILWGFSSQPVLLQFLLSSLKTLHLFPGSIGTEVFFHQRTTVRAQLEPSLLWSSCHVKQRGTK